MAETVHRLQLGDVSAYLVETAAGRVLVDTGFAHTLDDLREWLGAVGGPAPSLILLTHAHPDHAGGAAALRAEWGVPVAMHPVDAALVRAGSGGRPMVAGPDCDAETLARINGGLRVEPVEVDVELRDGQTVPGFDELRVRHAPGHCAGQVVVMVESAGVLVAADAASNRTELRLPRVAEDYELAAATFARLGAELDFEVAVFGHGDPVEGGAVVAFRAAAAHARGT